MTAENRLDGTHLVDFVHEDDAGTLHLRLTQSVDPSVQILTRGHGTEL